MASNPIEPRRPIDILDGGRRHRAIQQATCTTCGGPATEFRDAQERIEYGISGMCTLCQRAFFTATSREFLVGSETVLVTIAVDIKDTGTAVIEAFAVQGEGEGSEVFEIGLWSVEARIRPQAATLVIGVVRRWCTEHHVALDDSVAAPVLVFADLQAFLRDGA